MITVVTVATGNYKRFLPEWSASIAGLETQPDHVIVVTDDISECHLANMPSTTTLLLARGTYQHHPQYLINEAIDRADDGRIVKLDVDDMFLPHALNDLETRTEDVVGFGIRLWYQDMPSRPVTGEQILNTTENLLFSGSPFRKRVWEAQPYRDMIYEDWAFWRDAARNGFTFGATERVDYEYRLHRENISQHCDDEYWRGVVLA